ncbi:hypothetical protein ACFXKS_10245 [Streptomyces scopuliridis]|uniref:hypothetical protein n=1 Tax=Streptomyces scopuliridis TaxID=452529 RepID=UPI00369017E1
MAGMTVGCSAVDDSGPEPTETASSAPISLTAVCDGSLRGEGGVALKQISGADAFQPGPDTNQSMKKLAASLVTDLEKSGRKPERMLCSVSPQGGNPSTQVLWITFQWYKDTPPVGGKRTHSTYDNTRYGNPGRASAYDDSASLFFSCPTASGQDSQGLGFIAWASTVGLDAVARYQKHDAQVRILHAASVALAKQLGCFKQSGLPETLGELTPLPVK